jgi:hypothetical protein
MSRYGGGLGKNGGAPRAQFRNHMNSGRKQPQGTDLNCAWRGQFGDDRSDGFLHLLPKVESQRSTSGKPADAAPNFTRGIASKRSIPILAAV